MFKSHPKFVDAYVRILDIPGVLRPGTCAIHIRDNSRIFLEVLDIPGLLRPGTLSAIYRGQSWDILSSPGHPRTTKTWDT